MTIYRIYARFEPGHPRMAGRNKGAYGFTRGAWRVLDCFKSDAYCPAHPYDQAVLVDDGYRPAHLGFYATEPRAVGTLVNPFKVLKAYLASQKAAT